VRDLEWLAESSISTTLAYGEADDYYRDLMKANDGPLERIFENVELAVLPGQIHGFHRVEGQQAVAEFVDTWSAQIAAIARGEAH
jgi:hypothetical protein